MLYNILFILLGLALLVKGGDYLVEGASSIARKAKLSSMVIGLTVVGFGTSMPELLVSTQAALDGNSGIAIGNVVGSNIANIALILGLTGLIHPCPTDRKTIKIDTPFMVLSCVLLSAIGFTDTIDRIPGIIGILMLIAFIWWQIADSRKHATAEESERPRYNIWIALLIVVASLIALVYGADFLIDGASGIARDLGVSDRIIGLTIVAVGTSLPELFASVTAARKGETDMAIGNVIGSVTFNILSVIGVASAICPIHEANVGFIFDYVLMCVLGILLWLFLRTRYLLERYEGAILFAIYVAYIVKTVLF